jgi:hypothetical protein
MKNIMNFVLCYVMFFAACRHSNNPQEVGGGSVNEVSSTISEDAGILNGGGIKMVKDRMEKKVQIDTMDFKNICDFLFNENDEAESEEVGYVLFEYLKDRKKINKLFLSYLNGKTDAYKNKVMEGMVQIMCIDIGEENYDYERFINEFSLFDGNLDAKKAFEECMNNQVE